MSDSEDSTITYTAVSSPFGGLSNIKSPGFDGPPVMPEDSMHMCRYTQSSCQQRMIYFSLRRSHCLLLPHPLLSHQSSDDDEDDDIDIKGNEEEDESSDDDEDDDIDIEEEDEYLAPAESTAVTLPAVDHAPSVEETEPFETDELMAIPTPPPSPLSLLSSPLPHIPSPLLPLLSPPPTNPIYEEAPLGYRMARIRWRAERGEILEADLPLWKRLSTAHTGTYELGESSAVAAARLEEPVRDDLYRFQTIVETQHEEIKELRTADHKLQAQFIHAITALKSCQTPLTVALGRIQILEATRVPALLDVPEEAARDADRNPNGDDSHVLGTRARRTKRVTRECTYPDFMKCQPLNLKGTEGVVELTKWLEKMETMFCISNCSMENQTKFSTCTLLGNLKKKITNKYCPRGEMKKLESELWNLRVKSIDVVSYNQCFQELALLCVRMFPEESYKNKTYVDGFPKVIHRSVVASRPKTMQETIEMENELMDKRNNTLAERHAENKRKFDDTSRNNQIQQQQQNKRQNTGRAYTAGSGEKKPYGGSKPLCPKCNYHHDGPCAPKCHKCNKVGHFARDCRSTVNVNTANNQRGNGTGQKPTCYESEA
uniref:CCHC-type domain-containing protein n=1 Tax=Tanacetum cinerariifolium TaxID=118510 RepID=A0A6L2MPW4_TANCI|nr:hypothetical protein [Tanacetum cinerariifolium]